MILYKNTHLSDFEKIRLGISNLDKLYGISRQVIAGNIQKTERKLRSNQHQLVHLTGVTELSEHLGEQFIAHVERTARAANYNPNGTFSFNNITKSTEDLKSLLFWNEFVEAKDDPKLNWSNGYRQNNLTFSRSDLAVALSTNFEREYWNKSLKNKLKETIAELSEDLKLLRSADMDTLIDRRDFLTQYGDSEKCFDSIARELLQEGLAYQLVRDGYINRNFTLYTSTFHSDLVSAAAINFIIHHFERNVMDEYFMLDGADVDAVIRECGIKALGEPALYNICILDHLLRNDVGAADIMICSLISFGAEQLRFLQAYLASTNEHVLFIQRFVNAAPKALVEILSQQIELDEPRRMVLMDSALANLISELEYQVNPVVTKYLQANYAELSTLTSLSLDNVKAELIAKVFKAGGIRVPTLEPLSETVRHAFVAQNLYEVNRDNLINALGSGVSLALDSIREADENIYSYVIENLNAYLSAINGVSATVDSESRFIEVIEDVLANDTDQLREVIAQASESCKVNDLTQLSDKAWPFLAEFERFPAAFNNINLYIDTVGELEENLARVLTSARTITEHESTEENKKEELAQTIISSVEHLPSPALRAELAASLELEEYLDVEVIPVEKGELFALLLEHNVISDTAKAYSCLLAADWSTRESFIQKSTEFKDYITPALLQGDLAAFLLSHKIDNDVKKAVVDQADDYIIGASQEGLSELALFAVKNKVQLSSDVVTKLAANSVSNQHVVILLEPHLEELPSEQLFEILNSMGGTYQQLSSVGAGKPKIPNIPANKALLDVLKSYGIVSTYSPKDRFFQINKKHK